MVQPLPPLLVRILQLTLLLYMCELTSTTPLLDDVAPQRVRVRPPPQADPETVFLPDGSCCYDYEAYTFCLNPRSTPPRSACVQLCGNSLCVFRRQFDNGDEDHEAELVGLVESDIVDIHSLAQGSRRGCCTCVKSFVKVCLQPADEGLTCSPAVCGYKLCFGYCVES